VEATPFPSVNHIDRDISTFVWITDGKIHDVNVRDHLIPEPGAIYIMDRAYLDFQRLYQMHQSSAVFATDSKTNTGLRRIYSNKVDKTTGVGCLAHCTARTLTKTVTIPRIFSSNEKIV
jgi:hypothetical protein